MYLIARERVNFRGWDLCVNGIPIDDISNVEIFEFDGLKFSNFISMLNYLSKSFLLNKDFLKKVLAIYGDHRAMQAVKFCRLVNNDSEYERSQAFDHLVESFKEKEVLVLRNKKREFL